MNRVLEAAKAMYYIAAGPNSGRWEDRDDALRHRYTRMAEEAFGIFRAAGAEEAKASIKDEKLGTSAPATAGHPNSFLRDEVVRRRRDADVLESLANLMDGGAEHMGSNMPVLLRAVFTLCNSK